jgi:site-specific recombinase XerD
MILTATPVVARPDQFGRTRAETHALAFLARYRVPQTQASYALSLRQWFGWCAEHGIDPLEATRAQIEIFARELEAAGRKLTTVASKLNALAGYYRYAVIDDLLDRDPMLNVRRPRVERISTTQGLSRTEFADMLRAVESMAPRDHALICLLGLNGLRVSETCALQIEELGHHKGQRTAYLTRKGGKVQTVPMSHRTAWAVSTATGDRTEGPLLITRNGTQLDRRGAARIVGRVARRAGITKRITPHSLRHTFVTMALDAGQAERDIAISTGHSDTRMVAYYDRGRDNISRNSTHAVSAWVEGAI